MSKFSNRNTVSEARSYRELPGHVRNFFYFSDVFQMSPRLTPSYIFSTNMLLLVYVSKSLHI